MRISVLLFALLMAAPAFAQAPIHPATKAQMEANKQVVLNFFKGGGIGDTAAIAAKADKYLADDYVQHNPMFLQFDQEHHLTGKAGFIAAIKSGILAPPRPARAAAAPRPTPAPRTAAVVMAEGDLVTVVWKQMRPNPNDPSKMYEAYAFDTFRVTNGKMSEHWDGAMLPRRAAAN